MNTVSFTGHRDIKDPKRLKERLHDTVEELIDNGADTFYAGGARGFDTMAAETVIELRHVYPWVRLAEEQSHGFSESDSVRYLSVIEAADSVLELSPHYTNDCMRRRNRQLVDNADTCIVCYYNTDQPATGTGQTVRMAQQKGIDIINLFG